MHATGTPHAPARRFPAFTVAWLAASGGLFLAATGFTGEPLDAAFEAAVSFRPADAFGAPWRVVPALVSLPLSRDAVQYAYVTVATVLGLAALEWREGWRRAAVAFLAGGAASAIAVTFLVLLPLHMAMPAHPVVAFSVERSYMGASTAAYAALAALAAGLPRRRARLAVVGAVAAWEMYLWAWYYDFAQLLPVFHYAALAAGYALARSRWYGALPR